MPFYGPGFLTLIDPSGEPFELINHARTQAYLNSLTCFSCGTFKNNLTCCPALNLDPCSTPPFQTMTYTTPSGTNPAPWWDGVAGSPSSRAAGFWVEEWTGLDGAHLTRQVSSRAGARGGGIFGPQSSNHRTWKFNLILLGCDERALEALYRWLEDTLMNCCYPCEGFGAIIRTVCPTAADPSFGLYRVSGVSLIEGLQWEDAPLDDLGCVMRRVSFTLGVSDPCLYSFPEVVCATNQAINFATLCNQTSLVCGTSTCSTYAASRICCPIDGAQVGSTGPVVEVVNNSPNVSGIFSISTYLDPTNFGCDPCVLERGQQIRFGGLPSGGTIQYNALERTILYRDASTGGTWIDGTPFVLLSPGTAPEFLALGCDDGWVVIEPAPSMCNPLGLSLLVSVSSARRVGCC